MLLQNCLVFAVAAAGLAVDAATIHPRSNTPSATYPPPSWQARFRNLFRQQDGPTPPPQQPPPATTTPHHRLSQYQHDIVLRFNISTAEEARAVADAVNMLYLDVWSSTRTHIDIRLQQGTVPLLLDLLPETLQDSHSSLMHNLADLALETYPGTQESPVPHVPAAANLDTIEGQTNNNLFFADYQPLSVIVPWMDLLVSLFPSHVEILRIGKSFEGRKILGLKVGTPHPEGFKKRTVVVTGASHAREWISVSTVSYLAYSMITGFARDDKVIDRMVNEFDWIFIPTLNVDGYAYSWEHDRLWRKNRQPTSLAFCKGIDLDRAYDFHFDNSPQASTNPCSESTSPSLPAI